MGAGWKTSADLAIRRSAGKQPARSFAKLPHNFCAARAEVKGK